MYSLIAACFLTLTVGAEVPVNRSHAAIVFEGSQWDQRQEALHAALKQYPLSSPEMQTAIIRLLERETADPKWYMEAEGDEFNNYYEELAELCQQSAKRYHNKQAWHALSYSNYNSESRFGRWLAGQPETFSVFWEMSASRNPYLAGKALEMLGESLEFCQDGEGHCTEPVKANRTAILRLIRRKAKAESDVATGAIVALGECGSKDDVRFLEQRASAVRRERIDRHSPDQPRDRDSLLWLIEESRKKIEARAAAKREMP
jgi:hypothetical protein